MNETNARNELVDVVGNRTVLFGRVYHDSWRRTKPDIDIRFKSHEEYLQELSKLDFTYNSGFGGQELFGTVVFSDGTWIDRGEYDGSEWWEYHSIPTMDDLFKEED